MTDDHKKGCKVSVYFPDDIAAELETESKRLNRPTSWLLVKAWRLARKTIMVQPIPEDEA